MAILYDTGFMAYNENLARSLQSRSNRTPRRLEEEEFGVSIGPDDQLVDSPALINQDYHRFWRHQPSIRRENTSNVKCDHVNFTVNLDVHHFCLEELSVKTNNGYLVVEGKHEEKEDEHGSIFRHFIRKYKMPREVAVENVQSRLSCDGVLTIIAPRKVPEAPDGERNVIISQSGPVRRERKEVNPASQYDQVSVIHGLPQTAGHSHMQCQYPNVRTGNRTQKIGEMPGEPTHIFVDAKGAKRARADAGLGAQQPSEGQVAPEAPGAMEAPETQDGAEAQVGPDSKAAEPDAEAPKTTKEEE